MLAVEMPQSPRKTFGFRPFSRKQKNKDDYPHQPISIHQATAVPTTQHTPENQNQKQVQYLTAYVHRINYTPRTPRPPKPTQSTTTTPQRIPSTALPTLSFPPHTTTVPWDLFLPPAHIFALYNGHAPASTQDPWFIYSQGPDAHGKLKVHFHRARTGVKVAELFVVVDLRGEGAGKIVGVKWNRDAGRGEIVGEDEAKSGVRGACERALGVELEDEE